mmetsp:Transcript_29089/g.40898  ORF Transcript_29089/g.40898 Transcript_29089/m.40898 type:complete len:95 (-) Transcript_29089:41-325(-)
MCIETDEDDHGCLRSRSYVMAIFLVIWCLVLMKSLIKLVQVDTAFFKEKKRKRGEIEMKKKEKIYLEFSNLTRSVCATEKIQYTKRQCSRGRKK